MVQRREHLRLALEPRQPLGIARERAGQDLDRDVATEPRVAGAIDLAHAAAPEQRENLVAADAAANHRRETRRWDVLIGAAHRYHGGAGEASRRLA